MHHLKTFFFLGILNVSLQADITEIYRESVGESAIIPRPPPKQAEPKQSKALSNFKKELIEEVEPEKTPTAKKTSKSNHSWQTHKLIDWDRDKRKKKKRRRWRKRKRRNR